MLKIICTLVILLKYAFSIKNTYKFSIPYPPAHCFFSIFMRGAHRRRDYYVENDQAR